MWGSSDLYNSLYATLRLGLQLCVEHVWTLYKQCVDVKKKMSWLFADNESLYTYSHIVFLTVVTSRYVIHVLPDSIFL